MSGTPEVKDLTETTEGHLLDGRVRYAQPREGFRSGIEPVLLSAAIPARSGECVLEAGSGAGAALLCLFARVPGIRAIGIEQNALLVNLARRNAEANGWSQLRFEVTDIGALSELGQFDHACANPPYHPSGGTLSPDDRRNVAKRGPRSLLGEWARSLAQHLRPRGTLTFILPAALLPQALAAFNQADCRATVTLPLWPKAGHPAKLMLLRGVKGSRSPFRLLPGLVLHNGDGTFTAEAEAVLRGGSPLLL
jgi:tRNA1Val (adenine37-N6)-methyltransferase